MHARRCIAVRNRGVACRIGDGEEVARFGQEDRAGGLVVLQVEIHIGPRKDHAMLKGSGEAPFRDGLGTRPTAVIVVDHPQMLDVITLEPAQDFVFVHVIAPHKSPSMKIPLWPVSDRASTGFNHDSDRPTGRSGYCENRR